METLSQKHCVQCGSSQLKAYKKYDTVAHGKRQLFKCNECKNVFTETAGTLMQYLKSPISKVAGVLKVRSEGMGLRATARVFGMHKNTVSVWEEQFGAHKEALMLYSFCQQFISLVFEGDEHFAPLWANVAMQTALQAGQL